MNAAQLCAIAPIIVIAAAAVAIMFAIALQRNFALAGGTSACGIFAALLSLPVAGREGNIQATLLIRIDHYALFAMALLLVGGLAVLAFCYTYFKNRENENEECFLLLLTALLGSLVLCGSSHFASFFLGLETLSVSLFVLIGYAYTQLRSLEAAVKYLLLSGVASAFLLMGMALIYAQCGTLDFDGIRRFIAVQQELNAAVLTGIVLLLTGLGFKLSLAPFHMWVPDIYEGAPAPVAGFVATVSKSAVFILLLRLFLDAGGYAYAPLATVLSVVATLSIIGGNLLALQQNSVKRLLAYSSIAHMGYLLVAFIAGSRIAPALLLESAGFYLVAYSMTMIGAFGIVSVLSSPLVEADDLLHYRGLFWRRPWLTAAFTFMLLSLAGIPLTAGFIAKFYIFIAGTEGQLWGLLLAVIIGSGLGLYYYLRVILAMFSDAGLESTADTNSPSRHWLSSATLTLLTILLIWFGIYPSQLITLISSVSEMMG